MGSALSGIGKVAKKFADRTSDNYNRSMGFPTKLEEEISRLQLLPQGSPMQIQAALEIAKRHGTKALADAIRGAGSVTDAQGKLNPTFQPQPDARDHAYIEHMKAMTQGQNQPRPEGISDLMSAYDKWDLGNNDERKNDPAYQRIGADLQRRMLEATGGWSRALDSVGTGQNISAAQNVPAASPWGEVMPPTVPYQGYGQKTQPTVRAAGQVQAPQQETMASAMGAQSRALSSLPAPNPAMQANPTIPWLRADAPPELVKRLKKYLDEGLISPEEAMQADDVKPYLRGIRQ